jgi:hypothetical protein
MKPKLSTEAMNGLRRFCSDVFHDELLPDDLTSEEGWAWLWFQLADAQDRPEWFPKGKWATIQHIERQLREHAREAIGQHADPLFAMKKEVTI